MKKRFYGAAIILIAASTCFFNSGYTANKNEKQNGDNSLASIVEDGSDFQDRNYFLQLIGFAELQNLYNSNSLAFNSSSAYVNLIIELEEKFEQLSETEKDSDEYKLKMKDINLIWSQISILAGKLNAQLLTETGPEPANGSPHVMINNYFEQAVEAKPLLMKEEHKENMPIFISEFLKLYDQSFTFTYSVV